MVENNIRQPELLVSTALTLYDIGAVRFGEFSLHSGRSSPIYIDLRLLASFPDALRQAAATYRSILENLSFDLLAATPLAGLPIGTAICLDMNVPLIYVRPSLKGYGTGKQIEGNWREGQTAVMIDDLITSGDSLLQGIKVLQTSGINVAEAVVLLDREQGGRKNVLDQGYKLTSAMTLRDLLAILVSQNRITSKQSHHVIETLY